MIDFDDAELAVRFVEATASDRDGSVAIGRHTAAVLFAAWASSAVVAAPDAPSPGVAAAQRIVREAGETS